MQGDLKFASFKQDMNLTMEALCRELFLRNRESVRVIKEEIAVKNLVKILNAALTLCNRKGFASMSLRDLSKESGLSMGALYTYFKSKDDLLCLLQSQGRTVVLRAIESQIEGVENPRIKLRKAVQAHLYVSEIMQPWFYLSYMETKNFPREEHKKAIEAELFTEKLLIDIVRSGQEKRVFKPINSELLGAVIKAMLQDWYLKRWKYSQRRISVEKYAAFVLDFIESYLVSEP